MSREPRMAPSTSATISPTRSRARVSSHAVSVSGSNASGV
jgi:hypothetical protein